MTGGSIASVCMLFKQHHPEKPGACIIDFDIALVTAPALLIGVELGMLGPNRSCSHPTTH